MLTEWSFDGLAGPTHNYAGLSAGNLASQAHAGEVSSPRASALQGLAKARFVAGLGIPQGVLPPHERPHVPTLRRLGLVGSDADVLSAAARDGGHLLRLVSSASAMWTANAATVAPEGDTESGRTELVSANLASMFHRSLEPATTTRVLRRIFADEARYGVSPAVPTSSEFADEGAANHTRLATSRGATHLFGWGRRAWDRSAEPTRHPARQTLEASLAVARLLRLPATRVLTWQQSPAGIDAGAFHSDVLAVGGGDFLMLHELAFVDTAALLRELRARLGDELEVIVASADELPVGSAVAAYPFNSQVVETGPGRRVIVAPRESEADPLTRRFLERVQAESRSVERVCYLDVNASMRNGGGPACLRLRVPLPEGAPLGARVRLDDALSADLTAWVERRYRDRLTLQDLADPQLLNETRAALDELTQLLRLGSVYDFQRDPSAGAEP